MSIFFESFYGRIVGDNPLAIDAALTAQRPDLTRFWSVADPSIAVPEGATPVLEGTPPWHEARREARLLVVNDWLRYDFRPGTHQHVLQTWHGTPLKRLALSRRGLHPRRRLAAIKESRRWDILLAQNLFAAAALRRAYAFRGPVWVEGYPRNDILTTGDGGATRRALGIAADARVLLYAPTWRDGAQTMIGVLDLHRLAADTESTVLVRGHTRTPPAKTAREQADPAHVVIDVTAHPDTAALMCAADALITDYSSVMFDFPITGRPIYFFVPDLTEYAARTRGFTFDLEASAPGPLTTTQDALTAALTQGPDPSGTERYQRWRDRFTSREDGHAAERVVARILDQGLV